MIIFSKIKGCKKQDENKHHGVPQELKEVIKMQAYKYILDVNQQGEIIIPHIPQIKSSKVEIIIMPIIDEDYSDLMSASNSSTEFWNNPADEVWNDI